MNNPIWKQSKAGGLTLPDIKTYYKARAIKIVYYWYKDKHGPIEGLPWWFSSKEFTWNAEAARDVVWFLGQEEPLEEEMATQSSILV